MTEPILPPLKPIPIKDRISVVYLEKGNLDVLDGAFVVVDKNGVRTHIPVGGVACLMLEPGTRVSHAAVTLASRVGCLLGLDRRGRGAALCLRPAGWRHGPIGCCIRRSWPWMTTARLKVVRKMYALRFKEEPPERRSVEQLRGIEGCGFGRCTNCSPVNTGSMEEPQLRLLPNGKAAIFPTAA